MKSKIFAYLVFCPALIMLACSEDEIVSPLSQQGEHELALKDAGAVQVSGIGFYATDIECDALGQGADVALLMTGDLEGCHYIWVEEYGCSPSGTYRDAGRELFIGTYKGEAGSFETTYKFEAKFEGCADDGSPLGVEIFGRCQHPIVKGSGQGVFAGVTGRLDFKDDIAAGNFPFRGHFKFQSSLVPN